VRLAADASAILAILLGESDADYYVSRLFEAGDARISPVNWWEVQVRIRSLRGAAAEAEAAVWMEASGLRVEPVTLPQARIAAEAFARYKGRPARLNLGDCFAYALARSMDAPLLCKGGEFSQTDIAVA
jgi:ribonuclease VapC